jgi:hypothetical protein
MITLFNLLFIILIKTRNEIFNALFDIPWNVDCQWHPGSGE